MHRLKLVVVLVLWMGSFLLTTFFVSLLHFRLGKWWGKTTEANMHLAFHLHPRSTLQPFTATKSSLQCCTKAIRCPTTCAAVQKPTQRAVKHAMPKILSKPTQTSPLPDPIATTASALAASLLLALTPPQALAKFQSYDHAYLQRQDFSGQDLKDAVFAGCDCRQINLSNTNMDGNISTFANFTLGNLENSSWIRAFADRVTFTKANLRNVVFEQSVLSGTLFDGADVYGADFTEAIIDRAQVSRMCQVADGVNPKTGVATRDSLGCKGPKPE